MKRIKTLFAVVLLWGFLVVILVGTFALMLYMGYKGVTSGNLIEVLFGIALLAVALLMPFNFLRKSKVGDAVTTIFGYIMVLALLATWALLGFGIMILPFLDVDLSLDLGILVLKSGFVKALLLFADAVVLYYLYRWGFSFAKSIVRKRKTYPPSDG